MLQPGLALYLPFDGDTNDASTNGTDGINMHTTLMTDRQGNPTNAYFFLMERVRKSLCPIRAHWTSQILLFPTGSGSTRVTPRVSWLQSLALEEILLLGPKLIAETGIDSFFLFPQTVRLVISKLVFRQQLSQQVHGTTSPELSMGAQSKIYMNGCLETMTPKVGTIYNSSEPLRVGRYGFFTWKYHGVIDEVAVWNRALSLFSGRQTIRTDPPILYFTHPITPRIVPKTEK